MDKKKRSNIFRIIALLIYVVLSSVATLFLKLNYFFSLLLVIGIPSIVNFFWLKRSRKKVFVFSIISLFLFAIPVELTCRLTNTWDTQTIFPRLFGIIPIENLIFAFLNFLWVLSFYEYFIDKDTQSKIPSKFMILVSIYLVAFFIVMITYSINPLTVSFSYSTMALIVLIIPEFILFIFHPHVLKKIILPLLVFAFIFFIYEVSALQAGNWWWPGEYLYTIDMFGKKFPLDDVVFWYILSTPALIIGYETFEDDGK